MNDNERGLTFTERLALLSKLGNSGGGGTVSVWQVWKISEITEEDFATMLQSARDRTMLFLDDGDQMWGHMVLKW